MAAAAGPAGAAFVGRGAGRRRVRAGWRREAAAVRHRPRPPAPNPPASALALPAAPGSVRSPAWMGWKRDPREQVGG